MFRVVCVVFVLRVDHVCVCFVSCECVCILCCLFVLFVAFMVRCISVCVVVLCCVFCVLCVVIVVRGFVSVSICVCLSHVDLCVSVVSWSLWLCV